MREAINDVYVEGILNEIKVERASYNKDGQQVECIRGSFTIKVPKVVKGVTKEIVVPIHVFANKLTKKGSISPSYQSLETMLNEYKSIAMVGEAEADRVRVSKATITMNEFFRDGKLSSTPRISGNFVTRLTRPLDPQAKFDVEFFVTGMRYKTDTDGVEIEPKVLEIQGVVPQFGEKVDVVTFVATAPEIINGIEQYWMKDSTVRAQGELDFTFSTVEEQVSASAFGTPATHKRTISTNDLVITTGSEAYTDGEREFDKQEITTALIARKQRLENDKSKEKVKKAPAPDAENPYFGF